MNKQPLFSFAQLLLVALCLSCVLYACKPLPLGYMMVNPYTKPLPEKIHQKLYVYVAEEVSDSLSVNELSVENFRTSIADGLVAALQKNFDTVVVSHHINPEALTLAVFKFHPYWEYKGNNQLTHRSFPLYAAKFKYQADLRLSNKKITNLDGIATSEAQTDMFSLKYMKTTFQQGFTIALEELAAQAITDNVVAQVQGN